MENDFSEKIKNLSLNLEGILRKYLQCHYLDHDVKCELLLKLDWKKPIKFALEKKYNSPATNQDTKNKINIFMQNNFKGENIDDLITNKKSYGFKNKEESLEYIEATIATIEKLLSS